MSEVVAFEDAEVRIGGRRVFGPVTLRVEAGERWAILGPNGSGKTTLLRLAGAMRQPSAGVVRVLGAQLGRTDLRSLRPRIASVGHAVADMVPQSLAVGEVVLSGKRSALVPWMQTYDHGDRARATALLERFDCSRLASQPLGACSQGERQRVLLARALFGRPELLLLDEPAAGLDLPGREGLMRALEGGGDLAAVPTILVTHHLEEIPSTVTHVALLRDGANTASGTATEVLTSELVGHCFGVDVLVVPAGGRWAVAPPR